MRLSTQVVILGVILLTGCVPLAKEPLYTPGDVVFERALVGDYQQATAQPIFLKKDAGKSYIYGPVGQEKAIHTVRLLKLGDYYFMDEEIPAQGQHFFFKVGVVGQELRVWVMSVPWLKAVIEKDPKAVAYEVKKEVIREGGKEIVREQIILTGSTKDLQAFVLRYMDAPAAWAGPIPYTAKFKMPTTNAGLLSKKQQTFECWFEFRTIIGKLAADPLADPAMAMTKAAADLGSLTGDGIDPEAAAVVKKASEALQVMGDKVRKGEEARPLIKAFFKETAGPASEAAAKLSDRYGMKFGVIN